MNLLEAKFQALLKVDFVDLPEDQKVVLAQIGIAEGEMVEKVHQAPLGDPISIRIGQQLFALRKNICEKIRVVDSCES